MKDAFNIGGPIGQFSELSCTWHLALARDLLRWKFDYASLSPDEKSLLEPGVYLWWFKACSLNNIFNSDMIDTLYLTTVAWRACFMLLYVGKAEDQMLVERLLGKHLGRSAHVSTLRHSIGALIANRFDLPRCETAKTGKFAVNPTEELEQRITKFLVENAMVSWIPTTSPAAIEGSLIGDYRQLSLPLNILGNRSHPFCRTLSNLRAKYTRC